MFRILVAAVSLLVWATAAAGEIDWNDDEVRWRGYAQGVTAAANENKNIVLVVYADWCPTCKSYARMFFDRAVIDSSKNVILIRLNQDTDHELLADGPLAGDYVPRTYILAPNLEVQASPFGTAEFEFFLPPGSNQYLASLFKRLAE